MEVAMKGLKRIWVLVVMCYAASAAVGAHAAGAYMLTCEPARGGTITIPLIGFTFKVTGGAAEIPTGMAASGRRATSFDLMVRFAPGSYYQTMLSMAQTNEVLRSCRLVDGEGSGGVTAKDNWTQMEMQKGTSNPRMNNQPQGSSSGGALTWTFTNATVSSVTAIGNELPSGVTEGQIQATLSAERYEFTM
jgi:hypothetical protein